MVTQRKREEIIGLYESGHRVCDIAKITGISRKTVYFWIKRMNELGNVEAHHRQNYKRATTTDQDAAIVDSIIKNPLASTRDLSTKHKVSIDTIRRRLKEAGLRNTKSPTKGPKKQCAIDKKSSLWQKIETIVVEPSQTYSNYNASLMLPQANSNTTGNHQINNQIIEHHLTELTPVTCTDLKCTLCGVSLSVVYKCIQCVDVVMCEGCEASRRHPPHCVLKLADTSIYDKLKRIFETLQKDVNRLLNFTPYQFGSSLNYDMQQYEDSRIPLPESMHNQNHSNLNTMYQPPTLSRDQATETMPYRKNVRNAPKPRAKATGGRKNAKKNQKIENSIPNNMATEMSSCEGALIIDETKKDEYRPFKKRMNEEPPKLNEGMDMTYSANTVRDMDHTADVMPLQRMPPQNNQSCSLMNYLINSRIQ